MSEGLDPNGRPQVPKLLTQQRLDRPPFDGPNNGFDQGAHPQSNGGIFGTHQAMDRFTAIIGEVERILEQMPPSQSASAAGPTSEISVLIRQILAIVSQSAEREETGLAFSQKVVQLLYKAQSQLGREIYVSLLERLCDASVQVAREATEWLLYAEDEVSAMCFPRRFLSLTPIPRFSASSMFLSRRCS